MLPYIVFGILFIVLLVFLMSLQSDMKEKNLLSKGIDIKKAFATGRYVCGHPDLDMPIQQTFIIPENEVLKVYQEGKDPNNFLESMYMPTEVADININSIKDVTIEDATTIEKRITVSRLALVGLFAFALKKKEVNELAYVVIKWKQGKFKHETIFEFAGPGSLQFANMARNALIKVCSKKS